MKRNKLSILLLAVIMCIAMIPAAAFADGEVAFNTPAPIDVNGVTAEVSYDLVSPQQPGTLVTATITLSGTATEEGTHTVDLFSEKAGCEPAPQDISVTAGQNAFTVPTTYSFTLPAEEVDDLTLAHTFVPANISFTAPAPIAVNGVTATVSFDKTSPQAVGTEVTATITLTGTATAEGIHTVNLFSEKAESWGTPQDIPVTAGQTDFTNPVLETYSVTLPAQHVDDLVLEHTFVVPADYGLYLYEGKGYENDASGTEITTLDTLGITSSYDPTNGYTYNFDSVLFTTTKPGKGICIADNSATLNLTGMSVIKGGSNNVADTSGDCVGFEAKGDLTITGDGTLNSNAGSSAYSSEGIRVRGAMTVEGASVMGYSADAGRWSYGVAAYDSLTVDGGTVMGFGAPAALQEGSSSDSVGISVNDGLTVNAGSVVEGHSASGAWSRGIWIIDGGLTVTGGDVRGFAGGQSKNSNYGISVNAGDVNISGGVVEGICEDGAYANDTGFGFCAKDLIVTGGSVVGNGGAAGGLSIGVASYGKVLDVSAGSVEGNGGAAGDDSMGITADEVRVSGGSVTGNGGEAADDSTGIDSEALTVTGGTVVGNGGTSEEGFSTGINVWDAVEVSGDTTEVRGTGGETAGYELTSAGIAASYLTVDGGSVEGSGGESETGYSYGFEIMTELRVNGGNVTANGDSAGCASIGIEAGDVIVSDGSVFAHGGDTNYPSGASIGIDAFTLSVTGGNIDSRGYEAVYGQSSGITVDVDYTITGGRVEMRGDYWPSSYISGSFEGTIPILSPKAPVTRDENGVNVMLVMAGESYDGSDAGDITDWVGDGSDVVRPYMYMLLTAPEEDEYIITVTADPEAYGTATGGGLYPKNEPVTLTATPNAGYRFVKWTEGGTQVATSETYEFTATEHRTLVAVFEADVPDPVPQPAAPAAPTLPKTGDESNVGLWFALAIIALIGIAAVLIGRKRFGLRRDK